MKRVTPTQLRKDLYRILDEILESGEGIEVTRAGGTVLLLPRETPDKLSRLKKRSTILGDSDDIDSIGWEGAWQPNSI